MTAIIGIAKAVREAYKWKVNQIEVKKAKHKLIVDSSTALLKTIESLDQRLADMKTQINTVVYQTTPNGDGSMNDAIRRIDDVLHGMIAVQRLISNDALWEAIIDEYGNPKPIYVSPEWIRITGMPSEETANGGWLAFVHKKDADRVARIAKEALEEGRLFQAEYLCVNIANGMQTYVKNIGKPVKNSKGKIVKWIGLITEVEKNEL